jgi:hypothetical protein
VTLDIEETASPERLWDSSRMAATVSWLPLTGLTKKNLSESREEEKISIVKSTIRKHRLGDSPNKKYSSLQIPPVRRLLNVSLEGLLRHVLVNEGNLTMDTEKSEILRRRLLASAVYLENK